MQTETHEKSRLQDFVNTFLLSVYFKVEDKLNVLHETFA